MNLKDKSALDRLIGRCWMYRGTTYTINDIIESGGQVIISTDVKALNIPVDKVTTFISECLPCDAPAKSQKAIIRGLDSDIFKEISQGLMQSFRDIQTAEDAHLKIVVTRAKTKIKVAGSITNMAKVVLDAQRLQDK